MRRSAIAPVVLSAALAAACEEIPNPSGTCRAPDDGARAGYHSPQGSDWLPDCQNPLRREYWRVFAKSRTSAYTIPRLDGHPLLAPACSDAQHEVAPLVTRYALCAPAMSSQDVALVNNMAPEDAQQLTRFLHRRLRFEVGTAVLGITPAPIPTDILDACALHPDQNSPDLTAMCNRERDRLRSGNDIGFAYAGPGAMELAQRLNELYGIP